MSDFYASVKSTIDKLGVDIAQSLSTPNLQYANLDATSGITELLSSEDPAIVWQLASLTEDPRDPLYSLVFLMGAKTTDDLSNQVMSELITEVQNRLPAMERVEIYNYSGAGAVTHDGTMIIKSSSVAEQEFEAQSGIRFLAIMAAVIRVF